MPRGHKIVDWTPANETKLLHAIIAVHDIKIDYTEVAKQFGIKPPFPLDCVILSFSEAYSGDDVPAKCIQTHMGKLRKQAADLGLNPKPGSATAKKSVNKPAVAENEKAKVEVKMKEEPDHSDNASNDWAMPAALEQSVSTKSAKPKNSANKSAVTGNGKPKVERSTKKEEPDHADNTSDDGTMKGASTTTVTINPIANTKSSGKAKKAAKSAKGGKIVSGRVTKTRASTRVAKKLNSEANNPDDTMDEEAEIETKVSADNESDSAHEDIKVEAKVEEDVEM